MTNHMYSMPLSMGILHIHVKHIFMPSDCFYKYAALDLLDGTYTVAKHCYRLTFLLSSWGRYQIRTSIVHVDSLDQHPLKYNVRLQCMNHHSQEIEECTCISNSYQPTCNLVPEL